MSFNGYYFRLAHFFKHLRLVIKTIWLAIQIQAVATFLVIFRAHMKILFIINQSEDSRSHQMDMQISPVMFIDSV